MCLQLLVLFSLLLKSAAFMLVSGHRKVCSYRGFQIGFMQNSTLMLSEINAFLLSLFYENGVFHYLLAIWVWYMEVKASCNT